MLERIPVFPLDTVLFPGMPLQLHIFEKRYRVMVEELLKGKPVFGITLIKKGAEAFDVDTEPYTVGTYARIVDVEKHNDGKYDLTVVGENRFVIHELFRDLPYLSAHVSDHPLEFKRPLDVYRRIRPLRYQVHMYLQTLSQIGEDDFDISLIELPEDPLEMLYLAASLLQIPAHEKIPILTASTALDVCMSVERLYRRENAVMESIFETSEDQARVLSYLN